MHVIGTVCWSMGRVILFLLFHCYGVYSESYGDVDEECMKSIRGDFK